MNILTLLFFCLVKFVNSGFIETQIRSSSCLGSISFHHYHTDEFITKITNTTLSVVLSSGRAKVKMKLQGNCCFYVFKQEKCRGEVRKPSYTDALRPTNKGGQISVVKMDSWGSGCGANQTTVKKICKEKRKKSPNMESLAEHARQELLIGHPPFKDNGTIDKMEQDKDNVTIDKMEQYEDNRTIDKMDQDMTDAKDPIIQDRQPEVIEDFPFHTFNKSEKPELIMSKVSDFESINITGEEEQHISNDQVKNIINKMEEHKIKKDEVIINEMEEREVHKDEDNVNKIEEQEVQKDEDIFINMEEDKVQKDEVIINEMEEKEVQKVKDIESQEITHKTIEADFLDEITNTEKLDYSFMNEIRPSSGNPIPSKNYEQDKLIIMDDNVDVEVNSGVVTILTKINSTGETKIEPTILKSFEKEITTSDLHTEATEITTTDSLSFYNKTTETTTTDFMDFMDLYTETPEITTIDSMVLYNETTEIATTDFMVLYNETTEIAATDSMNFYIENTSTAMNIRKNIDAKPEIEERKNMTGTDVYYETTETYKNMTTLEGMDEQDSADKQSLSEKNNIRIQDMDSLAEEHKDLRTGMLIIPKEEITYKEIEDENTSTKIEEITSKEILDAKSEEPKLSTRDVSNVSTKILSPTMLKPYLKEALIFEEEQNTTSNRNGKNLNTSNPEISQTLFQTITPVTNDVKIITNEMMKIENKDITGKNMETTSMKTKNTEKLVKVETIREDKPTTKDLIAPKKETTMEEKPTMIKIKLSSLETTTKKEVGHVNAEYHIEPSTIRNDKNETADINLNINETLNTLNSQNISMIPKINEIINYRNTYTNTSYRKYTRIDENITNPNVYNETDTIFEQLNSTQTSQDSSYDFLKNKTRQTLENKLMTDGDNFIYTNNLEETVPGQKDSSSVNITDKTETVTNRFDRPQSYSSISASRSFSSISGMQFLFAFFTLLIQSYYK